MKTCTTCKQSYPATPEFFGRATRHKDGLRYHCKTCGAQAFQSYYKENVARMRVEAREKRRALRRVEETRLLDNARVRKWAKENLEKTKLLKRSYRRKNLERQRKKDREYEARRRCDPSYRLACAFSWLVRKSLRSGKAGAKWESVVGYGVGELMAHLEQRFTSGMSWENYGKWHIDHIKPRSLFSCTSASDPKLKECWALENLQPLWAEENRAKSNRYSALAA